MHTMKKVLLTAAAAAVSIGFVLQALRPQGAGASIPPPSAALQEAFLPAPLPEPQAPFDVTPITPVESAGAPMYAD
jgi:hypothetical protein